MDRLSRRLNIYVDGASRGNPGPAAIGVVIKDAKGTTTLKLSSYIGKKTNNQAEYTALIMALQEARKKGAEEVHVSTDSQLMSEQINGNYKVRNSHIRQLFDEAMQLLRTFQRYSVDFIPRERNSEADALANQALNGLKDA